MSKLSKFKAAIPMKEAANLLSTLINEEVDEFKLLSLYDGGWIRLFRTCHGEIVSLKPMFEKDLHEDHVKDGRYYLQPDAMAGVCLGFYLPCDTVQVDGRLAYAIRDLDGGFYAIRDSQSDMFISPQDEGPDDIKFMALTSDIYKLAEMANKDSIPEKPPLTVMLNDHCVWIEKPFYNFSPTEDPKPVKLMPDSEQEKLPPSLRITVAALLEAATTDKKKHTQASLIASILDRNAGIRGLSESSLQKHFSDSNAELTRLRKAIPN